MTPRELAELAAEYALQNPKKKQERPVPAGLRLKGTKVTKKKE